MVHARVNKLADGLIDEGLPDLCAEGDEWRFRLEDVGHTKRQHLERFVERSIAWAREHEPGRVSNEHQLPGEEVPVAQLLRQVFIPFLLRAAARWSAPQARPSVADPGPAPAVDAP